MDIVEVYKLCGIALFVAAAAICWSAPAWTCSPVLSLPAGQVWVDEVPRNAMIPLNRGQLVTNLAPASRKPPRAVTLVGEADGEDVEADLRLISLPGRAVAYRPTAPLPAGAKFTVARSGERTMKLKKTIDVGSKVDSAPPEKLSRVSLEVKYGDLVAIPGTCDGIDFLHIRLPADVSDDLRFHVYRAESVKLLVEAEPFLWAAEPHELGDGAPAIMGTLGYFGAEPGELLAVAPVDAAGNVGPISALLRVPEDETPFWSILGWLIIGLMLGTSGIGLWLVSRRRSA